MDPLATRPPHVQNARKTAQELVGFVASLLSGGVRLATLQDARAAGATLRNAFDEAPPRRRAEAFDAAFAALQRNAVPPGPTLGLLEAFVHAHAGSRMAILSNEARQPASPAASELRTNYRKRLEAAYPRAGGGPGPASGGEMPIPRGAADARKQGMKGSPPNESQALHADATPRPPRPVRPPPAPPLLVAGRPELDALQKYAPQRPTRAAPPPPDEASPARHPAAAATTRRPMGALRMSMPNPFDHVPALQLQFAAERLNAQGDAGKSPSFLSDFLRRIGRDDLPVHLHARTFDQLAQALQRGVLSEAGAISVHAYLTDTMPQQLERLQVLHQKLQVDGGDDAELHAMVKRLRTSFWLNAQVHLGAAALLDALDVQRAEAAVTQPGGKLAAVAEQVGLRPVAKRPLRAGAVLPATQDFPAVRISQLTGANGAALAWVSSTLVQGGFSKFKPAILADGRVLGLRMARTLPKGPNAAGRPNTHALEVQQYLSERRALGAVQNRYEPLTTLVDQQGRLYEVVPLAEGDLYDLTQTIDDAARAQVLPVALEHLLGDLARVAEAGFRHRDIKPDNVMWQRDGSFALADFGFAHRGPIRDLNGTPEFMAPEMFDRRQPPGEGVDVWAVGLTAVGFMADADGIANFPLSFKRSQHTDPGARNADYAVQATAMRADYATWRASMKRTPSPPMSPAVAAIDAAYRKIKTADPQIADLLFFQMLNPDAAARPSAAAALAQLQRTVPAQRRVPALLGEVMHRAADESPAGRRRMEVIAHLQRERDVALGLNQ